MLFLEEFSANFINRELIFLNTEIILLILSIKKNNECSEPNALFFVFCREHYSTSLIKTQNNLFRTNSDKIKFFF